MYSCLQIDLRNFKNSDKFNLDIHGGMIDGINVIGDVIKTENGLTLNIYSSAWIYDKQRLITMENVFVRRHKLFQKTYLCNDNDNVNDNVNDYALLFQQIDKDILIMKFNKLDGILFIPGANVVEDMKISESLKEMYDMEHFPRDLNDSECCVCLENTRNITPCGHKLCIGCWGQIKWNRREKSYPCPLCRKNLTQREALRYLSSDDEFDELMDEIMDSVRNNEIDSEENLDIDFGMGDGNGIEINFDLSDDEYDEFPSVMSNNNYYDFY